MSEQIHEHTLEIEACSGGVGTVEYLIRFQVDPGEKERPRTFDCGGTPGWPPSIDWAEVYLEQKDRKTGKVKLLRREELDCLINEDELLHAAGADDSPDCED